MSVARPVQVQGTAALWEHGDLLPLLLKDLGFPAQTACLELEAILQ
jgi:hypothetical protein